MEMAALLTRYRSRYLARYGATITAEQGSALNAITGCRTVQYGEVVFDCPSCHQQARCPLSCGNRACNRCLNHCTTEWLARQQRKLLPVDYYMVTFTLPAELRAWARRHPAVVYGLMFDCASATVKQFGRKARKLSVELAMTAVLHTHNRRLDYHPHIHLVVPAGGVDSSRSRWRSVPGKYLFNGRQLAAVFRGRLLRALTQAGLRPGRVPKPWIAQCQRVGNGLPALKYLSRYLYRGVISDRNILRDDGTFVTFRYKNNAGETKIRRLPGESFVALLLQHVLPKGFRRVRDYGFLHGNAQRVLRLIQWTLRVSVPPLTATPRPTLECSDCQTAMQVVQVRRRPLPGR